jgi:hypothetical protein
MKVAILTKTQNTLKSTNTYPTISVPATCTCRQAVTQLFIDSGCSQDWLDSNPDVIESVRFTNLSAWIWNFTESWENSSLKTALDRAIYFRNTASFITESGFQEGLTIVIEPQDSKDYKLISSKYKQIRYRIKLLDKEAQFFLIRDKFTALGENLQTGETIYSSIVEVA